MGLETITVGWLKKENACEDAVVWAQERLGNGKPLAECIAGMKRADWLLWLLWYSEAVNIRQFVKLACVAGRVLLCHIPIGEDRPSKAYVAAEAWVMNPTADSARAASWAAWVVTGVAGKAAVASQAAAKGATMAAEDALAAARIAAGATGDIWGPTRIAGDAASGVEHRNMCIAIRAELEKPEFKMLEWPIDKAWKRV